MEFNIVIVGAGQLGSRYLQGLAAYPDPLNIQVIDINQSSLEKAKEIWVKTANAETHSLLLSNNFELVPEQTDLAIISTSADVRESVVSSLVNNSNVDNWLLEKVLAQSASSVNRLESLTAHSKAWVNTYFRTMGWFKDIRQRSATGPIEMKVIGGSWGIGCNSVHFLDFAAWWTGEELTTIDNSGLLPYWYPAKRNGFQEVKGILKAHFSGGSTTTLISDESNNHFVIKVKTKAEEWMIDWEHNVATRNDGFVLPGKIPYQSEMTKNVAADILLRQESALPTLQMSAKLHCPFLDSLVNHWNKTYNEKKEYIPIT